MVGEKQSSPSPYTREEKSHCSYSSKKAISHTRIEPYTVDQPKSKFIQDIDKSASKKNILEKSRVSQEATNGINESGGDMVRISLKNNNNPLAFVEQGVRSGTKERLDSGSKGINCFICLFIKFLPSDYITTDLRIFIPNFSTCLIRILLIGSL